MAHTPHDIDELLALARVTKERRMELERDLEKCRRTSKSVAIALIFDHGYSVLKTSVLTGHMRPTIKVWVDAEIARRGDHALTSHITPDSLDTP
jgi:hypothetical protein